MFKKMKKILLKCKKIRVSRTGTRRIICLALFSLLLCSCSYTRQMTISQNKVDAGSKTTFCESHDVILKRVR